MLTFEFSDVSGYMSETAELTSGMVGREIQIILDDSWKNLNKTYVFRAGDVCRTVIGSGPTLVIPEEVLALPFCRLYVGVYGTDEEGTLVIPTILTEGPMIRYGADPTEDPVAEELPVWKRLQEQIGDLQELETSNKASLVAAVNELSQQIRQSSGNGLSSQAVELLIRILRSGIYESDQTGNINVLALALSDSNPGQTAPSLPSGPTDPENPDDSGSSEETEVTLTRISVMYTRGDVPVGTPLEDLTGIIVTAYYSDGTTRMVTDFTRSGTIAAGSNTITVSYMGMSATFTVSGIVENNDPVPDQTETLEIVYASSYPNVTTFAYTEQTNPSTYAVAKRGNLKGGLLSVDFDASYAVNWNLNLYVFDADGNPYLQTDKSTATNGSDLNWGIEEPKWEAVGAGAGFGIVSAPFQVQLPEGCTCIACFRAGQSGISDFSTWAKNGGVTFTVTTYK